MPRRTLNPHSLLFLTTLALVLVAVLPPKWSRWTGWFRGPFLTVIAPISGPMTSLSSWLRPGENRRGIDDADAAQLRQDVEFYKSEYLRLDQQIEQMRQLIEALQSGVAYGSPLRLKRLEASRVGADLGAGTIDVSRGSTHGVTLGTVAVATTAPQHLVGVVSAVGPTVSTIHVMTDRRLSPNLIDTLVLPTGQVTPEALARAPRCQFRPTGDGALTGELSAEDAARIQRGDAAFLDDPSWPPGAQRLIVGRVTRTEDADNPLFKRLVILPDLDLNRIRSVVLRIPTNDETPPIGGTP
jgi:cell shape-determining protein MreC